jgi:hypothetical protein
VPLLAVQVQLTPPLPEPVFRSLLPVVLRPQALQQDLKPELESDWEPQAQWKPE